jgi:acyl carrier protein
MNSTAESCLASIVELIRLRPHMAEDTQLNLNTELADAGIDSIDLMVVFSHFEESAGLDFDDDEVAPELFSTLGDLAAFFADRINGKEP